MEEERRKRKSSIDHDRSSRRSRRATHSSHSRKREHNRSRSSERASKRYKRDRHDKSNKNDTLRRPETKSVLEENWDRDDKYNKNDTSRTQEIKSIFEENWDKDDKNNKNDTSRTQEIKSIFEENWDEDDKNNKNDTSRRQEMKSTFEENWDKDDKNNKNDTSRRQEMKSTFEENWDKDDKNNKNDTPHTQEIESVLEKNRDSENENKREEESFKSKKQLNPITSRTGGAYIPPAKLKMLQAHIRDKSSAEYQRIAWEALKKSIHGLINKVNKSNIAEIIKQLLKENIVRGRGLLCKSIIQAQALSLTFTNVYAALVALINSRFPNIGELLLRRLVLQFKRGFRRNNKTMCVASTTFIAHLVNQRVAHEILALEILTLLVETPTAHSIEIAISFLKECGMRLTEVSRKGIEAIFQMLRNILHEGKLDKRVDYMVEVIFQIRRNNFKDHEAIIESLDLVEEEDQFTHIITLEDATDGDDNLNAFKFDPQYLENEEKYKDLSKEMLGESGESDSESGSSSESEEEEDSNEENEDEEDKKQLIIDRTETNLVSLRRTIYLTIYSSLDYEECAHKLMKMDLKPGQEVELCNMILDCCCEMRTYEKFFGLLAQRFCLINKIYVTPFENMFKDSYDTVYRLKPNQLRNVAKFFAHLLYTDAISWEVLSCIRLNEEETTSSGRIFIKIVFQELSEHMGLSKLNERVKDVTLQSAFTGLFPRDNPKNARFAINFFTSIGLGGLTDDLREHLKGQVKAEVFEVQLAAPDSSTDSSSEDSSDSSSSSESESSDSSDHRRKKSKQKSKRKIYKKKKKSDKAREERKKVEKREKKERRKTNKKPSKSKHRDRR